MQFYKITFVLLGTVYLIFNGIHCQPGVPYYQYGRPGVIPAAPFPIAEIAIIGVAAIIIGLLFDNINNDDVDNGQTGPDQSGTGSDGCPENSIVNGNLCYSIHTENKRTKVGATSKCNNEGGALVHFETLDKMNFLAEKIKEKNLHEDSGDGTTFLTRGIKTQTRYIWGINGETIDSQLFADNEPNESNGICTILSFKDQIDGELAQDSCLEARNFICEKDVSMT